MIPAVMPTYARAPLEIERGEGAWLVTTDGTRYLDFGAGIAVNALGHAHPRLVEALTRQAQRLWHTSNMYAIAEQERLAARLVEATFADTVFFTNSGVEAIECALKTARKYHFEKGTGRTRIISFEGSFHGRSLAAISAAGSEKMTKGFGPLLPGFDVLPWGDHDALQAAVTDETAAILVEPVQGEGGVRPLPQACLRGLRQLCDQHGLLLILDEIQSGVGRTGRLFAHEHAGVAPDIMAVAKGIGGGVPLGACLATEEAASGMGVGAHGSTYGGNPLACAVGNAVLDEVLAEGFLDEVERKAGLLRQRLAELKDSHPGMVADIRGVGLMIGMKLTERAEPRGLLAAARDERLLLVAAADNTVRILPPLNVTDEEIGEAVHRLDRTLGALEKAA